MRRIVFLCVTILFFSFLGAQENCYKDVVSIEFHSLMKNTNAIIIDVRQYVDYEKERIEGSILASEQEILESIIFDFKKTDTLLIYCDKGTRSAVVASFLCKKEKFKYVFNLKDGLNDWKKKGFELDKAEIFF